MLRFCACEEPTRKYQVTTDAAAPMRTKWHNPPAYRRSSGCPAAPESSGSRLGLDNKWMVQAIKAAGNYAEIFERNVGQASPLKLNRA
jgi:general L-amino acid transport system substrate-binding protein